MPRLSLYNPRLGNDYKFIDKMVKAHFEHGGTALLVHKYIGGEGDGGNPKIQDVLFMENRDRKYETVIYELRGVYTITDQDFDLSQFGMFLGTDQVSFEVHFNDMVERIGRTLMTGDVIELPHDRDNVFIDEAQPGVNQFWVVQEGSKSAAGYSPGWNSHIWRIRCKQLQDTAEYTDIFGTGENADDLKNLLSTYKDELAITQALVAEAEQNVPGKYYDYTTNNLLYIHEGGSPDDLVYTDLESGTRFPENPQENTYFLRTDYKPHRVFQYRTNKWFKIEDDDGAWQVGNRLQQSFINNTDTVTIDGVEMPARVNLSKAVKPKADE